MRLVAVILLSSLLYGNAAYGAPCAENDNECLLKLTLQQTYDLEAARKENAVLRRNLDEEIKRADNGPKFFLFGMVAGAGFLGIAATIALKAIKAGAK